MGCCFGKGAVETETTAPLISKFCNKCGVSLIPSSQFCHKCGASIPTNSSHKKYTQSPPPEKTTPKWKEKEAEFLAKREEDRKNEQERLEQYRQQKKRKYSPYCQSQLPISLPNIRIIITSKTTN
eukprot:TRINITY_DN9663_c0_g1_i1.p1 TRINITY_DN9663_c0_g1~~TRINITY_DN9663_c0_g1_i1.p1  ORF type:complete len:125 (-),score=32.90 TRINITY_DN9663_c0_g1_i1:216-590(-)